MSGELHEGHEVTLADQVAALARLTTAELAAEYERLAGRKARYRSVPWLRKRIAHQLQVAAFGGLSRAASAAIDAMAADIALPPAPRQTGAQAAAELRPGTVLHRDFKGQRITVEVTADGFVWDGNRYGSLSAVAHAVTGSRWNGKLFFNLTGRKPRG